MLSSKTSQNTSGRPAQMSRRSMMAGSVAGLAACSSRNVLVNAPTVFADGSGYPMADVIASERTAQAPLFFMTDRALTDDNTFEAGRSASVSYGEYIVDIGPVGTSFDDLLAQAKGESRTLPLSANSITIEGTLPATPVPFTVNDEGEPVDIPVEAHRYEAAQAACRAALARRIAQSGRSDILVLIPGVSTPFSEGAFELAEVWHHSGRTTVPVLFSWPSGQGGLIGYFTDRESGDFSVFHLKEFLKIIASTPGVERVHVLAHSRGTGVATSALRELIIAERAAGRNPRKTLKIENLILAAADINFDVVGQRIVSEQLGPAFGQLTAYTNQGDEALALAQRLMLGARFGRLDPDELPGNVLAVFSNVRNVNFIQVQSGGGLIGHSY